MGDFDHAVSIAARDVIAAVRERLSGKIKIPRQNAGDILDGLEAMVPERLDRLVHHVVDATVLDLEDTDR